MAECSSAIRDVIRADWSRPVAASVHAVAAALQRRHGTTVGAVLFYGSCLRGRSERGGLLDLYVLVDSYEECYAGRRMVAWANRLLPPNVFYFELPWQDCTVRVKYAVITFDDFADGAGPNSALPAIWARFSQPTALVMARDEVSKTGVQEALVSAVTTMALRTAPLVLGPTDAAGFWTMGYARSYRAEARVEGAGRATELIVPAARYEALLRPALAGAGVQFEEAGEGRIIIQMSPSERRLHAAFWSRADILTRLHSIPRLAKAAYTFEGGVDYALWKIERHSGVRVEATPWQRRHPLLASVPLLWRAYRRGAFRRV